MNRAYCLGVLPYPGVRYWLALCLAGAALVLMGCGAGHYYPLKGMSAEEIKAATASKEATLTCITATYAGAKATTVIVNADKGIPAGVTVDENCITKFDTKPVQPVVPLQVVPR